jgi:beta-galactosidase
MKDLNKLTRREAVQGVVGIAAAAILPGRAWGEHGQKSAIAWPNTADSKRAQPFNNDWRFHPGDAQGADAVEFDDSAWRRLDVPHDWSIEDLPAQTDEAGGAIWTQGDPPTHAGPFDIYASEGQWPTGWTVGGVGWYRKVFDKPQPMPNGKVELIFEGVYMNCDVWLNGTHLGNHPYGYTEFAYDITAALKDGKNALAVRVNNTGRNSRWYSGSGIFRKVRLSVAGGLRVPAHGVFVTLPEVGKDAATVNVEVTVENGAAATKRADVHVRLVDADESVAGETQATITVPAGSSSKGTCVLEIANPHLWSPADPHLYLVQVAIESDRQIADSTALQIGVRKVEIDAAQGLRVNGESIKLRGGCVHHDNGPLGSACIPRAEERRVEILKANGYNAIRTSHNPTSPDFLDACDRLGMLVIDEAFDCWEGQGKNPQDYHLYFKDWWQRDLESMVLRDRNHPCVVLWSIGNEIPERAEPSGVEIGKALAAVVHKLDPTRKVTAAIPAPFDHPKQTWQDMQPAFTYLDVGGYNYQWEQYASDHAKFPERIMVGTESFPNQVFQNWQAVESNNWVIGDFVWTAIDYLGESGIGHASIHNGPEAYSFSEPYPWFNSYCGDIDLIGNKKPQSYFRDVVWRRSPMEIAVQRPVPGGWEESVSMWGWSDELRSWTWPGLEGAPLKVRVYSRASQVKLLLNGKEVGSKNLTKDDALKAEFTVPYSPGELKAVAYENGTETGSVVLTTVGKAQKLVLTPDRSKLKASRDDLSYVMVSVVDDEGRPLPDEVVPVSFTINGAGEIAAVGNANPKDVASFRQPHRKTFHGVCLVVVRPTGVAGQIEVRADSPGLEGAAVQLQSA